MITLYKRHRVWWIRKCEDGKEFRQSLRTKDPVVAKARLRVIELENAGATQPKKITWPDFQKEFLSYAEHQIMPNTYRAYKFALKRFAQFIEAQRIEYISIITPATIAAYMEERSKDVHRFTGRTLSRGGLKADLRVIRRTFSYAIDCGYVPTNPVRVRNLNSEAGRTLPFTAEEVQAILTDSLLSPQMRAFVMAFLHTGMRLSDVLEMTKAAVAGEFIVRRTIKRHTVVSVPVHSELREAIREHLLRQNAKQRASELLFSTTEGKPVRSAARDLRALFKRAKVEGGHAHRFRDTYAVNLLSKGASLYDVAKMLGIGVGVAERHYTPWVKELQERAFSFAGQISYAKTKAAVP